MKKVSTAGLILGTVLLLGACGNSDKGSVTKPAAEAGSTAVKIKSGSYVLEEGDKAGDGTGYLALEVSVKNISKNSIDLSSQDFSLYDKDDDKISEKNIYSEDDSFRSFDGTSLSKGKSVDGYIVFPVEKEQKYELHFKPILQSDEKSKEITLKVDASKYHDDTENIKKLAEQYVSQVFLNKTTAADKENKLKLNNDLGKEHNDFNQQFSARLKKEFTEYVPSDAELGKAVESFETANQKKAKINYTIDQLFPNEATVNVLPEMITFDGIDTDSIITQFVNENEGKYDDYEKASIDAEKYLLQQLPSKFDSATTSQPSDMSGEGYKINLTQKDGKWIVDSSKSDSNYDYQALVSSFMGGLYE